MSICRCLPRGSRSGGRQGRPPHLLITYPVQIYIHVAPPNCRFGCAVSSGWSHTLSCGAHRSGSAKLGFGRLICGDAVEVCGVDRSLVLAVPWLAPSRKSGWSVMVCDGGSVRDLWVMVRSALGQTPAKTRETSHKTLFSENGPSVNAHPFLGSDPFCGPPRGGGSFVPGRWAPNFGGPLDNRRST